MKISCSAACSAASGCGSQRAARAGGGSCTELVSRAGWPQASGVRCGVAMQTDPCTRPTVYLFDIDGTLLSTGGAGRRAMEAAFAALTGNKDACAGFSFAGMQRVQDGQGIDLLGRRR